MKPILFALLLVVTLTVGCKKSTDDVAPATTATTFPQILAPGTWVISSYVQGTEDKLKALGSISINFTSDGKATATQGGQTTVGSWSWGGNSYYGTPADSKTVTLSFGIKTPYDKLSKTWTIMDANSSAIKLDNSNPAENEHLTLTK
ncbi:MULTISPECIES: hypothetical protein [unclassified Spirosoma]|uniref:hypothetical protein n=1 Tax=unclassified Spirosoma TaxID=2621999 RepID=UPI00095CA45D|nr:MULTISPECIES: hypothetical protein [unclassified Spirosoma]MBN8825583.1 hypothetical protein [Spirosoma sp.]OJW74172.1 MAG: hypothetical protein BGO59_13710 [Spirosoma sp. 48-14]